MGRSIRKASRKRKQKFQFKQNVAKKKHHKMKKVKSIKCSEVSSSWDNQKTTRQNLDDMGLVYDINKALPIPKTRDVLKAVIVDENIEMDVSVPGSSKPKPKEHVIEALKSLSKQKSQKGLRLSEPEVRFCTYMIEKYAENFDAMARDSKNYYQDTPAQIRKKINRFKNIPAQYSAYLRSKGLHPDCAVEKLESLSL